MNDVTSVGSFFRIGIVSMRVSQVSASLGANGRRQVSMSQKFATFFFFARICTQRPPFVRHSFQSRNCFSLVDAVEEASSSLAAWKINHTITVLGRKTLLPQQRNPYFMLQVKAVTGAQDMGGQRHLIHYVSLKSP